MSKICIISSGAWHSLSVVSATITRKSRLLRPGPRPSDSGTSTPASDRLCAPHLRRQIEPAEMGDSRFASVGSWDHGLSLSRSEFRSCLAVRAVNLRNAVAFAPVDHAVHVGRHWAGGIRLLARQSEIAKCCGSEGSPRSYTCPMRLVRHPGAPETRYAMPVSHSHQLFVSIAQAALDHRQPAWTLRDR